MGKKQSKTSGHKPGQETVLDRFRPVLNKVFGRPLKASEEGKEKLSIWTGVPVLGLDALASTAYGPEAALTILIPLGVAGLHQMLPITIGILALGALYLSYRQTAAATGPSKGSNP
jgi:hypothetical protein